MAQIQTPEIIEAINHWVELFDANSFVEAENIAQMMVATFPENATCWRALYAVKRVLNKTDDACFAIQQAFAFAPDDSDVCHDFGVLLTDLGNFEVAEIFFRKAILHGSKNPKTFYNLVNCLTGEKALNESSAILKRCVELLEQPADHFQCSLSLLRISDFLNGWREYRWVYHPNCTTKGRPIPPRLIKPEWQGESLQNKTIIIFPEQGFGDFIQFVRYSELLKNLGVTVWVMTSNPLINLFQTVPWIDKICRDGEQIKTDDYDFWSFFMALPYFLKTDLDSIPCNVPYFSADETKSAWWRDWLNSKTLAKNKRVGLVWAGNPEHINDARRSISFSQLAVFSGLENVTFVSLQLGEKAQKEVAEGLEGVTILDTSAFIADFSDSAALLKNLDLLITVDSAPAHLAGALNCPVWVMIPAVPDWRWLLERDDSPWYPSMRLFRQPKIGDWASVLADVKIVLEL